MDPNVHQYLMRMNFYREIGATVAEPFLRRAADGRFLVLTRIDAANESAIFNGLRDCLIRDFGLEQDFSWSATYLLSELSDNFRVHSGASTAYLQAQSYRDRLSISLADRGMSIPGSMRSSDLYTEWPAADLLAESVKEGTTSRPDSPGMGLFMTAEAVRENGGKLQIISADACLTCGRGSARVEQVAHWQGTLIAIELKKKAGLRVWEMFPSVCGPDDWGEVWTEQ